MVCLIATSLLLRVVEACPMSGQVVSAIVKRVVDGDTIWLNDGRKIRLIGINSPEMGQRGTSPQPYALQAKTHLKQLLPQGQRVWLREGRERYDRYKRLLAHVFTRDEQNVQSLMLKQGYAAHIVIPPNLWQASCYAKLEKQARQQQRNMWSHWRFQPIPVIRLSSIDSGFYLVSGRISDLKRKGRYWLLSMQNHLTLKITVSQHSADNLVFWSSLIDQTVVVKGWISRYKRRHYMNVKHPLAVELLD